MNALPPCGRRLLIACFALGLLFPPSASTTACRAEGRPRRNEMLEGTHAFRRILLGFKPLTGVDQVMDDPSRTVLIVLGNTHPLQKLPGGLQAFVEKGGAVLIATDRAVPDGVRPELIGTAGVSVNPETVVCWSGEEGVLYHERTFCPFLQPDESPAEPFRDSKLGRLGRVATNVPSFLIRHGGPFPGRVRRLADLPVGCGFEPGAGPGDARLGDVPLLFAVGGDFGRGRILVLADHSIFINQMMLPDDNHNVEFAYNCVTWLADDGGRGRDRVLFIDDGVVRTDFNVPLRELPLSPERILELLWARRNELLVEAEGALVRAEDENAFNRFLLGSLEQKGWAPRRLARAALLVLTLLGLIYAGYRLSVRARRAVDRTLPLLAQPGGGELPTALQRPTSPLYQVGNLGESAGYLARAWFVSAGLADADLGRRPRVLARGGWWQRLRCRSRVRRLWRLARGAPQGRVSPLRFRRLLDELAALKAAVADGSLRLAKG